MAKQFISIPAGDIREFQDAKQAMARIEDIYNHSIETNYRAFKAFAAGEAVQAPVQAFYPYVFTAVESKVKDLDHRLSWGFVRGKGTFGTTITRPALFHDYLEEQLDKILCHHHQPLYVGVSHSPIPIHFSFPTWDGQFDRIIGQLDRERVERIPDVFAVPNLKAINDNIANGNFKSAPGEPYPLSIFTAQRVDISLQRLVHYTGTKPEHFQNFVVFTNYPFYVDEFIAYGKQLMKRGKTAKEREERQEYSEFVEPGNITTPNANLEGVSAGQKEKNVSAPQKQMPAYHLKRKDGNGVTMINIGVGPSNAKTITDHVAVLRPHCWLMLGHCAGLRQGQRLGDYVLAHGYLREDQVLDEDLPIWIPVPPLAEVQQALQQAVADCTGVSGYDLKNIMRTGTVATTANRNWELEDTHVSMHRFSQSRAIAVDMESATIAANGFRFRVPYGTLLCVSDRPVHGELKLPGMADQFYRERVNQHLQIGLASIEYLRRGSLKELHSRKLRTFIEPAFR
ncbi:MAG: AMP nucleosidase [bacterium]|nr:AMP nucleosidase [bacterium]